MDDFDLAHFLPYRLTVLAERVSRRLSVEYEKEHRLSVPEWRVMVHLARFPSASVRDIQSFVNLEKPRVSRAVARLERNGLVTKLKDTTDARLVEISLTDRGEQVLADIVPKATAFEQRLLDAVPEQEMRSFLRVLECLHGVLDDDPAAKPYRHLDISQPN